MGSIQKFMVGYEPNRNESKSSTFLVTSTFSNVQFQLLPISVTSTFSNVHFQEHPLLVTSILSNVHFQ